MLFLSGYYESFNMLNCVQYCWYYGNYNRNLKIYVAYFCKWPSCATTKEGQVGWVGYWLGVTLVV